MSTEKRTALSAEHSRVAAEIAAATPHYDPLARRSDRKSMAIGIFSVLLHAFAMVFLWNVLFGDPLEPEETIVVSMVEEQKPPEPEPEKARPKAIQRRTLNAATKQRKEVVQNEIRKITPVPVVAQVQKVEIDKPMRVEAPRKVTERTLVTRTVNEFADVQVQEPLEVASAVDAVKTVQELQQSSGPRRVEAAGPVVQAADYNAPNVSDGVIDQMAAQGDVEGARISPVEAGNASRYTTGDGERGIQPGQNKDCSKDPVCLAYLKEIERRVYARWRPGAGTPGGKVQLAFQIDKSGAAYSVKLQRADDDVLGDTCATAFRQASPFPPPPPQIQYLTRKGIVANFFYESGSSE